MAAVYSLASGLGGIGEGPINGGKGSRLFSARQS